MTLIETGPDGFPVLLADAQSAPGLATRVPRLLSHQQKQDQGQAAPDSWHSGQWDRRSDIVRDAAREFETFGVQDARDFVLGRANRVLSDVEVQQLLGDVREQQLTDLADALDHSLRGIARRRRLVRVVAPRGYVKKTLNGLTDQELNRLEQRLGARGWTPDQIDAGVRSKLSPARAGARQNPA